MFRFCDIAERKEMYKAIRVQNNGVLIVTCNVMPYITHEPQLEINCELWKMFQQRHYGVRSGLEIKREAPDLRCQVRAHRDSRTTPSQRRLQAH